jgi:hypothetical protein
MGIGDFDGIRPDSALFGFLRPVFMAATLNFSNILAALFCEGSKASWKTRKPVLDSAMTAVMAFRW